ncbi:hypothetical protein GCM10022243_31480 [Saccharothrix violaceirubra]|uniref:Regulator of SigK n=1 Tax=Saccharothrix violaceirubra TaxID=413306 RepID=A0A7W7T577_9PSEU|nr:anti-sigma factor [Saccharothrix violaceirubra]MBB4966772.1 hypothetical protein [Saccharothrix violaceirubra]
MTGERRDAWCPQEELAVGWAMHTLEPDEEAFFSAHLSGCALCARTVRSTQEVTAVIGGSVPQYDPPPRLRGRLMEAIGHTPQQHVVAAPVPEVVVALRPRQPKTRRNVLVAAAAVVLVAAVGIVGVRFGQMSDQLADQDRLRSALEVAVAPGTDRAVLRAESGEPIAVLLSGDREAAVMPMDLKSNDVATQTYVVWGTSAPIPVPLATFDVGSTRDVRLLTWSPDAHKHRGFAISLEPGRAAPSAPTDVVAKGAVDQQ